MKMTALGARTGDIFRSIVADGILVVVAGDAEAGEEAAVVYGLQEARQLRKQQEQEVGERDAAREPHALDGVAEVDRHSRDRRFDVGFGLFLGLKVFYRV